MNITLNDLKKWNACSTGLEDIEPHITDPDEPIPLNVALKHTTVPNIIWALSHNDDKYRFQSLMIDIVESMQHINTDPRVSECIQALKDFRDGKITADELRAAAARAAAAAAAAYAARAAAAAAAAYAARAAAAAAAAAAARAGNAPVYAAAVYAAAAYAAAGNAAGYAAAAVYAAAVYAAAAYAAAGNAVGYAATAYTAAYTAAGYAAAAYAGNDKYITKLIKEYYA